MTSKIFTDTFALGKETGLDIKEVSGWAKGYGSCNLNGRTDHAWNVITTEYGRILMDATWGAGHGSSDRNGRLVSTKEYTSYWFDTDPNEFVLKHLPEKSED